jgi:hypothetical protein
MVLHLFVISFCCSSQILSYKKDKSLASENPNLLSALIAHTLVLNLQFPHALASCTLC